MAKHSSVLARRIPGTGGAWWAAICGVTQSQTRLKRLSSNLCKWNYLYGNLPFYKIQVNHFMARDESPGAKIIPKCILWMGGLVPFWVLRHSFISLTDCLWLYNIQLNTSRGVLFLPPSDAYVRSSLYLLYTSIKLYYTKSSERSSLITDSRSDSSSLEVMNPSILYSS